MPPEPNDRSPGRLLGELIRTLAAYVSGQVRIAFILALLYSAGYALAGVPAWWLVGPLCGVLHLVPILGPLLVMSAVGLAVWLGGAGWANALGALGAFVAVQGFEGFYLTPKILGSRVNLPPLVVFVVLLLGGALFGFFGVLLAVPAAAIFMVLWRFFRPNR